MSYQPLINYRGVLYTYDPDTDFWKILPPFGTFIPGMRMDTRVVVAAEEDDAKRLIDKLFVFAEKEAIRKRKKMATKIRIPEAALAITMLKNGDEVQCTVQFFDDDDMVEGEATAGSGSANRIFNSMPEAVQGVIDFLTRMQPDYGEKQGSFGEQQVLN